MTVTAAAGIRFWAGITATMVVLAPVCAPCAARDATNRTGTAPDSGRVMALLAGMLNATCPLPGVAAGGQPDAKHLKALRKAGFRTVLDLRLPGEPRGFDEAHAARSAGLRYRVLPIGRVGVPDSTFEAFRELMSDASIHPVLVHCASGNRVGPVMIAWLVLDRGWDWGRAVEIARSGGLRSEALEAAARDYVDRRRP